MKLYANLIKEHLKKDPHSKGFSVSLEMQQISTIFNINDFLSASHQPLLHLNLSYNYLKSIEPVFSSLKSLQWLDLSANHIEKIENLSDLRDLEYLNLSTNRINSLENLDSLLSLRVLDLSMNFLTLLTSSNLQKLEVLNVLGNEIREFADLQGFLSLKQLDISKNGLENLQFLREDGVFRELLSLKCNYNRLNYQYFEKIVELLQKFDELQEIELIGNEITLHKEYRFLSLWCPRLQKIDAVAVSKEKLQFLKVFLRSFAKFFLQQAKIDQEFAEIQEKAQHEYLSFLQQEHENKRIHKKLLSQRRDFIAEVFETHEKAQEKELAKFAAFSSETKRNPGFLSSLPAETLQNWRETLKNGSLQRARLAEIAVFQQAELKRQVFSTKLASTKLSQKLAEIALHEPEVWQELKRKELSQVLQEEQTQIKQDREIPREESEEKEDDLLENLEEEFRKDVGNVLSRQIREIQTKDLQKERAEAANIIKKTLNNKKIKEGNKQEKLIKLQKFEEETQENRENLEFERLWGMQEGDSLEIVQEDARNLEKQQDFAEKPGENAVFSQKTEPKDWKSKREEFLQKQRKLKETQEISLKKPAKSKKCSIF